MRAFSHPSKPTVITVRRPSPRSICAAFGASLLVLGTWPATAEAAKIAASVDSDFQSENLRNVGTFWLYAYSQQYASANPPSPAVGPNASSSITSVLGGVPGTVPSKAGNPINIPIGTTGMNQTQMLYGENARKTTLINHYGPTVTQKGFLQKSSLARAGDNVTDTSTSGMYTGQASAFISARGVRGVLASASINGSPPPAGAAAGEAYDPFEVPSGTAYAYTPTLSVSLELNSSNESGTSAEFATDSSVFTSDSLDAFVDDGAPPDETLWYLTVGDTGGHSAVVDFQLNPLALAELQFSSSFLAPLGPYTDATSEATLIDGAIDRSLASQLVSNSGAMQIDDAQVFPDGTTFQAAGSGVEYA
ncbi:MAG: hypothetical protein ACREFQ_08290, partial [Stellaceae bacterium]